MFHASYLLSRAGSVPRVSRPTQETLRSGERVSLLPHDRELLAAYRKGDESALRAVYLAYSDEVAVYLERGLVGGQNGHWERMALSTQDVQAAHQETFIRAFSPAARQGYDGVRPFPGFLRVIARSVAIDLFRRLGKVAREWVPLDDSSEALEREVDAPSPEEQALVAEVRMLVRRFLDTLPPEEEALADARFIEGTSQEQLAARLGVTRFEVRSREKKLREAFVAYLVSCGWLEKEGACSLPRTPPP